MTTPVPWSMKKLPPIRARRMDVDAGARMRDVGDEPRQEGGAELVQSVGEPIVDDGGEAGIDQQDLGIAGRGRIALIGGAQVADQQAANARQLGREIAGDLQRAATKIVRAAVLLDREGQAAAHLLAQGREGVVERRPDEIVDGLRGEFRLAVMGGEQRCGEALYGRDDGLARGRRAQPPAMADIVADVAGKLEPGDHRIEISSVDRRRGRDTRDFRFPALRPGLRRRRSLMSRRRPPLLRAWTWEHPSVFFFRGSGRSRRHHRTSPRN